MHVHSVSYQTYTHKTASCQALYLYVLLLVNTDTHIFKPYTRTFCFLSSVVQLRFASCKALYIYILDLIKSLKHINFGLYQALHM